ncbi:MAG: GFA family protein [Porticoccaceae bacterium]|nr:GFA family protein [Porticoccaceae bacterium]
MNTIISAKGHCLCGAVQIEANTLDTNIGACHCSTCRRWGGGPLLAVDCQQDVKLAGKQHIATYNSSDWAERGFCNSCGSHLFYRLKHNNQYIMPVGLFELSKEPTFDHQIFIDEKPDYYCFANDTKTMTGEEVFAAHAPQ